LARRNNTIITHLGNRREGKREKRLQRDGRKGKLALGGDRTQPPSHSTPHASPAKMTTIQGMPPFSTSSTDSLMENKGGFLWPDNHPPPEGTSGGHGPGSFLGGVDFFDEFVVLDGTDSLASSSSSGAERDRGRGGRFKAEAVTPPSISGGAAISGGSAMLPPGRMVGSRFDLWWGVLRP